MPRTLTILLNSTRDADACFPLMQKNLLDPMDSDLAFCGALPADSCDIVIKSSKYVWGHDEPSDWSNTVDNWRGNNGTWRTVNELSRNHYLFGLGAKDGIVGSGIIVSYWRDYLSTCLTEEIISKYEWFVFTRSDYYWNVTHPPVQMLDPNYIYIQDAEYHTGIPDRHFIVPTTMVAKFIQLATPIFSDPKNLISRAKSAGCTSLNIEAYLKFRFQELGLLSHVLALPQFGFLVRSPSEESRHSWGELHRNLGLYVKYLEEFRASSYTSDLISQPSDWHSFVSPMTNQIAPRLVLKGFLLLPFHSNEIFWRPGRLLRELRRYKPIQALLILMALISQLLERKFRILFRCFF